MSPGCVRATQSRVWSHDALRRGDFSFAEWMEVSSAASRCYSLVFDRAGGESIAVPSPTEHALENWIGEHHWQGAPPHPQVRFDKAVLLKALQRVDWETRRSRHPSISPGDRKVAASRVRDARSHLSSALQAGLRQRLGQILNTAEERTYVHFVARRAVAPGLRVCQSCLLVFSAPRADLCPGCRKSPKRPRTKPWHAAVAPTDAPPPQTRTAFARSESGSRLLLSVSKPRGRATYEGVCQACGKHFDASDARQRYCDGCGSPKARAARARAC